MNLQIILKARVTQNLTNHFYNKHLMNPNSCFYVYFCKSYVWKMGEKEKVTLYILSTGV